jgi:hypothetical protein
VDVVERPYYHYCLLFIGWIRSFFPLTDTFFAYCFYLVTQATQDRPNSPPQKELNQTKKKTISTMSCQRRLRLPLSFRSCQSTLFLLLALAVFVSSSHAFQVSSCKAKDRRYAAATTTATTTTQLHSTAAANSNRPTLVDQNTFVAAIERVEDEIARAMDIMAQQQQQEGTGESNNDYDVQQQQEEETDNLQPHDDDDNDDNGNVVYAIGRLFVDLPVDQQPELDLTESTGPTVLVTGVWGKTAEISGLQPFDTITRVTVGSSAAALSSGSSGEQAVDGSITTTATSSITAETTTTFAASCLQSTLEETAAILTAAAQHALQNGKTTIQLEVNRLIEGYYAPPPTPQSSTTSSTTTSSGGEQQSQQQ